MARYAGPPDISCVYGSSLGNAQVIKNRLTQHVLSLQLELNCPTWPSLSRGCDN